MIAGDHTAGLKRGSDDACVVVDLPPRHELGPADGGDRGTDERDPGGAISGRFEALDRGGTHRVEGSCAHRTDGAPLNT